MHVKCMRRQGRILVIDDLQEWREQITSALQRGGFQADAVPTTVEALSDLIPPSTMP